MQACCLQQHKSQYITCRPACCHSFMSARTLMVLQAQLEGGEWVDLLGLGHPGIAEVKWCANRFTPFLCIAPHAAATAGKQDAEEFIEVVTI